MRGQRTDYRRLIKYMPFQQTIVLVSDFLFFFLSSFYYYLSFLITFSKTHAAMNLNKRKLQNDEANASINNIKLLCIRICNRMKMVNY